jgi:hypothetical protein
MVSFSAAMGLGVTAGGGFVPNAAGGALSTPVSEGLLEFSMLMRNDARFELFWSLDFSFDLEVLAEPPEFLSTGSGR